MTKVKITRIEIDAYKREILEQSVLVCLPEAARILGVSEATVRRRAEERVITPHVDPIGGSSGMRFLASELRDYVKTLRPKLRDE